MRDLSPFEYTPPPVGEASITFKLKPLDMRGFHEIRLALSGDLEISWAGVEVAARYIAGWTSEDAVAYSKTALTEILTGAADVKWSMWLTSVAGELFRRALVKDDEEKKF